MGPIILVRVRSQRFFLRSHRFNHRHTYVCISELSMPKALQFSKRCSVAQANQEAYAAAITRHIPIHRQEKYASIDFVDKSSRSSSSGIRTHHTDIYLKRRWKDAESVRSRSDILSPSMIVTVFTK